MVGFEGKEKEEQKSGRGAESVVDDERKSVVAFEEGER